MKKKNVLPKSRQILQPQQEYKKIVFFQLTLYTGSPERLDETISVLQPQCEPTFVGLTEGIK